MSIRYGMAFVILYFSALWSNKSLVAGTLRPMLVTGLMQQPSSQYYHFVYGAQIDVGKNDDSFYARIQYLERPKFESSGYVDQDFSASGFLGTSVLKYGNLGLNALFGGGSTWGYLRRSSDPTQKNKYRMPGIATALEAKWGLSHFDVRLSHQVMICQSAKDQLEAYVAWPFNWFLLSVSSPISIGGK